MAKDYVRHQSQWRIYSRPSDDALLQMVPDTLLGLGAVALLLRPAEMETHLGARRKHSA